MQKRRKQTNKSTVKMARRIQAWQSSSKGRTNRDLAAGFGSASGGKFHESSVCRALNEPERVTDGTRSHQFLIWAYQLLGRDDGALIIPVQTLPSEVRAAPMPVQAAFQVFRRECEGLSELDVDCASARLAVLAGQAGAHPVTTAREVANAAGYATIALQRAHPRQVGRWTLEQIRTSVEHLTKLEPHLELCTDPRVEGRRLGYLGFCLGIASLGLEDTAGMDTAVGMMADSLLKPQEPSDFLIDNVLRYTEFEFDSDLPRFEARREALRVALARHAATCAWCKRNPTTTCLRTVFARKQGLTSRAFKFLALMGASL